MSRNKYMLKGKKGYDWWWHSFVGYNATTGEAKSFFIEYFIINPDVNKENIILGENKQIPSYAMIKAGAWGLDKRQIHNFYPTKAFSFNRTNNSVMIGDNICSENDLKGKVFLSKEDANNHPEYMSDEGYMEWDLYLEKKLSYSVGYGASRLLRALNAFSMYWHVEGMSCEYTGIVNYNGVVYNVTPNKSFGYQDKNWGTDFTNPWIWLNCNNLMRKDSNERLLDTSFDVGGGCPVLFGMKIPRKILVAFFYQGKLYEYNFSKLYIRNQQSFKCYDDETYVYWDIVVENNKTKLEISFKCRKETMILVNYENPDGMKYHNNLWNGGDAFGELRFYKLDKGEYYLVDTLTGSKGGCEYGEY